MFLFTPDKLLLTIWTYSPISNTPTAFPAAAPPLPIPARASHNATTATAKTGTSALCGARSGSWCPLLSFCRALAWSHTWLSCLAGNSCARMGGVFLVWWLLCLLLCRQPECRSWWVDNMSISGPKMTCPNGLVYRHIYSITRTGSSSAGNLTSPGSFALLAGA